MILFDNLATGSLLGGPSLDRVVTSAQICGRVLGTSEMTISLPMRAIIFATGNNPGFRGDTRRRVVPCRLVSQHERPEERMGFEIPNLIAHTKANRGRLVASALTILRAYFCAGRPRFDLQSMSFDGWEGIVRNAVRWTTGVDPCETRRGQEDSDPETERLAAFLEGWSELPGSEDGLTVANALEFVEDNPDRYEALRLAIAGIEREGKQTARVLGDKLNDWRERVVGGLAFQHGKTRGGSRVWFLVGKHVA
jgi:putative DNA primase/helicase